MELRYRLLNVFVTKRERLSGNPLAVIEDGRGLSDEQMQAVARQFNLSETTFIFPAEKEGTDAKVRIFTPSFEMPFAGHPTLGTAHVVRTLAGTGNAIVLDMKAGLVEVVGEPGVDGSRERRRVWEPGEGSQGERWTLRTAKAPETRPPVAVRNALAAMLSLRPDAVADTPLWVDTGAEQLVIPLATADDVRAAKPNAALLAQHGFSEKRGAAMAYAWAPMDAADARTNESSPDALDGLAGKNVLARFFFIVNGGVVEDPATGSACANLGGWFLAMKKKLPLRVRVEQGAAIHRPSILELRIDEDERIFVSGAVLELGSGTLRL